MCTWRGLLMMEVLVKENGRGAQTCSGIQCVVSGCLPSVHENSGSRCWPQDHTGGPWTWEEGRLLAPGELLLLSFLYLLTARGGLSYGSLPGTPYHLSPSALTRCLVMYHGDPIGRFYVPYH